MYVLGEILELLCEASQQKRSQTNELTSMETKYTT